MNAELCCSEQHGPRGVAYRELMVLTIRSFTLSVCLAALCVQGIAAQEPARYREFVLGSDLASVAKLAGAAPSSAKVIHAAAGPGAGARMAAAVLLGRRLAAHNRPRRRDAFQVLRQSAVHGRRGLRSSTHRRHVGRRHDRGDFCNLRAGLAGAVAAARDADRAVRVPRHAACRVGYGWSSVTLLRVAYPESFRLVVALTRIENLARTATEVALRLDTEEAPQRELARLKKQAADSAAAQEKAKTENKAQFKP